MHYNSQIFVAKPSHVEFLLFQDHTSTINFVLLAIFMLVVMYHQITEGSPGYHLKVEIMP